VQRVASSPQELGLQLLLLLLRGECLLLLFHLLAEGVTFGADLLLQLLTPAGQISLQGLELLGLRPPVGQHVRIGQISDTGPQGLQLGGLGPQKAIACSLLRFLRRFLRRRCWWCRGGRHGGPGQLHQVSRFQATSCSCFLPVVFIDEMPELRSITEDDWQLVEHLAELANQRGDIYTSGTVNAHRAVQLLEMPGAAVQSIVTHLAYLRRDDLVDSLELADQDDSLTEAILQRRQVEAERIAAWERQQQAIERNAASRELSRAQAWQQAQSDPQATLQAMQEVVAEAPDQRTAVSQLARMLGVKPAKALAEMQPEIERRQLLLLGMISTGPVVEAQEPPADPRAELIAEAQDWASGLPTVQQALDSWQRRGGQHWAEVFRFASVFQLGETAVLAVADAVGVDPAEVRLHAARLAAVEDLQQRQVAAAYTTAEDLLQDALAAGSWAELSWAVDVAPWQLERRCAELLSQS
jgi:hypothetical protein